VVVLVHLPFSIRSGKCLFDFERGAFIV